MIKDFIQQISGRFPDLLGTIRGTVTYANSGYTPEVRRVAGTVFGELSNQGGEDEVRQILSTMVNRAKNRSLQAVISEPAQYQAWQGTEYRKFLNAVKDVPSQRKAQLVNKVIEELVTGKFKPVTSHKFFVHDKEGKIKTSEEFVGE